MKHCFKIPCVDPERPDTEHLLALRAFSGCNSVTLLSWPTVDVEVKEKEFWSGKREKSASTSGVFDTNNVLSFADSYLWLSDSDSCVEGLNDIRFKQFVLLLLKFGILLFKDFT
jgi:hypothetical protein